MVHSFIILLPMMTCLFWFVCFLCALRQSYTARRMMSVFYGVALILYACHCAYFLGIRSPFYETVYGIVNLLVFPLFLYYVIWLSGKQLGRFWWLLTPSAVILVAYPLCFIDGWEVAQHYYYIFARICFAFQVIYVWISGSRMVRNLANRLDDYFTDGRSASLKPLNVLLWLFGVITIFSSVWNFIGRERFLETRWIAVPSILMSVLLFALGYVCFVLPDPLKGIEEEKQFASRELAEKEVSVLMKQVNALMIKDKPYLREDLTISEVSVMVGTNRSYLSAAINKACGVNFSTYINRFRIEEAKKILSSRHYNRDKEAIADAVAMSGFANEQTFYRVFKEQTGQTPLLYRRLQLS